MAEIMSINEKTPKPIPFGNAAINATIWPGSDSNFSITAMLVMSSIIIHS
ncbi:MAG: hypothetical protein L7H18_03140 [Candidatus Nealsonbacteria bacterium DGGOD1a]|nr:MAG: hypothetical protein L7H18_03140 [Candidatus Nealsonbacteria bacterium DGGOD1a]